MSAAEHAPVHRSADAARAWRGAAILSRGFRPFFLGAGVWAVLGIALWSALMPISACAWAIAFADFVLIYGALLIQQRNGSA